MFVQLDTEADDLLCTFQSPLSAFSAAVEGLYQISLWNDTVPNADFKVSMSGCGIECSGGVIYDPESKRLFGPAFDRAFKIGEDMCNDGEILVGEEMYAVLQSSPFHPFLTYTKRLCEEWSGTDPLPYYSVAYDIKNPATMLKLLTTVCNRYQAATDGSFRPSPHALSPRPRQPTTTHAQTGTTTGADSKAAGSGSGSGSATGSGAAAGQQTAATAEVPVAPTLTPAEEFSYYLKKRAEPGADIASIDSDIHARWTMPQATTILFSVLFDHVMHDAQKGVWQFKELSKLVRSITKQFDGVVTEQWNLCAFVKPENAVAAGIEFRAQIRAHNASCKPNEPETYFKLNGIGMHAGALTLVPGTDVHWGDCVNTAAKLADDVCTAGQLMMTDTVYQLISTLPAITKLELRALSFMRSGVELKCHEINPAPLPPAPTPAPASTPAVSTAPTTPALDANVSSQPTVSATPTISESAPLGQTTS